MKYGMSDDQFDLLSKLVILPLKSQGAQVFIFGSRARASHHPHSDVDLLFKVSTALPPGLLSKIREDIEESRFPFTVELVNDEELAESYRKNVESCLIPL